MNCAWSGAAWVATLEVSASAARLRSPQRAGAASGWDPTIGCTAVRVLESGDEAALTLLTRYPFDAVVPGGVAIVVWAVGVRSNTVS